MKNILLLFFFQIIIFPIQSQNKYPCLKGDCENGFGMKKLNETYTYVGYHKNGKRHGLTFSFNEDNTNKSVAIFTSNHGKSTGPRLFMRMENDKLKDIRVVYETGSYLNFRIDLKNKKHEARTYQKSWFILSKYNKTINDDKFDYNNDKLVYKQDTEKLMVTFFGPREVISDFIYKPGSNWFIEISTRQDNGYVKFREEYDTKIHWGFDGLILENDKLQQKIVVKSPLTFPEFLGNSFYKDLGTVGTDYFHQFLEKE